MTEHETQRAILSHYMHNVLASHEGERLTLLLHRAARVELELDRTSGLDEAEDEPRPRRATAAMRTRLKRLLAPFADFPAGTDFADNIAYLREEFALDDLDTAIVRLLVAYSRVEGLESFADGLLCKVRSVARAVACLIGWPSTRQVHERFLRGGALVDAGLLVFEPGNGQDLAGRSGWLRLTAREAMFRPYADKAEWLDALTGPALVARLPIRSFEHVSGVDLAVALLRGALAEKTPGVVVAIHGPPGTGKTELAKSLAAEAGAKLFAVGEADEDGGEPERADRLGRIVASERILSRRPASVILVDEAEDVLALPPAILRGRDGGSKVFVNRLLERCRVPLIVCCNDPGSLDPAVRRRVSVAVEMPLPGPAVRERIWSDVLRAEGLDAGAAPRLAAELPAPAGVAAIAARAARLAGAPESLHAVATGVLRFMGTPIGPPEGGTAFHADLVQTGIDVDALIASLRRPGAGRAFSICAYGPPGTGKSALVRHVAESLGYRVLHRRASDLLSMYVGGSERRIADAFAQATAENAFLVFDEADSLLSDRRDAARTWEVSQVNEMLTWMEVHRLPFACTTNLVDRLDPACLRRFTFKLEIRAMDAARAAVAFRRFFGVEPPPGVHLGDLTPGDFAVVRRKAEVMGRDPADLARWLREEALARGDVGRLPIGFATR